MPNTRRSLFQSLASVIGLSAVASETFPSTLPLDPSAYGARIEKNPYLQTPLPAYPGSPANDALYQAGPFFRHGMSFGPDWLHKSAEDARARDEDLAWIIAEPKTPQAFRDRKLRRQLHAYRLRVFHSDTPPLSAEAYFRSRTLTDHLKDFQEALKA